MVKRAKHSDEEGGAMTDADILPVFPEKPPRWKVGTTNVVKRYLYGASRIVAKAEKDAAAGMLTFDSQQRELLSQACKSLAALVDSWQSKPGSYMDRQKKRSAKVWARLLGRGSDD